MPRIDFDTLPADARIWIFAADRPLVDETAEALLDRVDRFLEQWHAHGVPLAAARRWSDDRFLIIGVDERAEAPSGCSIDALLGSLKVFEKAEGLVLTDHVDVTYRDTDGGVARASRPEFARMAREGTVDLDTPVFDTTLTRKRELGASFEVPAAAAWHGRAFWRAVIG